MGTPDFACAPLKALAEAEGFAVQALVCQPDKAQGRNMRPAPPPTKRLAEQLGIEVLQPLKLRDGALRARLAALAPDFLLTCAYGRILPADILATPRVEALNLHASLLPKYRGAAPMQWALWEGEKRTGVSLMRMDEALDHGAIFAQESVPIGEDMDLSELSQLLAPLAAEMAVRDLPRIAAGELRGVEQEHALATYTRTLRREDGALDWSRDARALHNQIRACHPWPAAYTGYRGKRLKIYRARPFAPAAEAERIGRALAGGELLRYANRRLLVGCGRDERGEESVLELLELQAEGGKRLPAADFVLRLREGERLEPCPT